MDAFDAWLTGGKHSEELAQGIALAKARRAALKKLIQEDPQAALARAVPYPVRQQLPGPVVALLETPVSTVADFDVEQACGGPEGSSWRHAWVELEGQRVQVFTYGERADTASKQKLSVHGIAVDEVMAMLDDPLRELSAEEAADKGFTGRVAQVGQRFFAVQSDAAIGDAREQLRATEQKLGPLALPAYRELALGRMDGIYPLAMLGGTGAAGTNDDLPPVAFSAWTEGAKTMLYIRARFADEAPASEPLALATAQFRQGGAENFWLENSYGKSSLTTTYTDVVTLPSNASAYVNNFGLLRTHAWNAAVAANPSWDPANFDFYTVITTGTPGAFGYIGIAQIGGPGSHLLANFTTIRTASHEYGHNLGLNHSEYWLTDSPSPIGRDSVPGGYVGDSADAERIEYGHKFAVMGSQDNSGDFEGGRAHYAASDKNRLDWLVQTNGDVVSTTNGGTFRLFRHDLLTTNLTNTNTPVTNGVARAIKINLPASDPTGFASPYRYWLSYRFLPIDGIANDWLRNGLQVDWRRDDAGFRAVMLDMTPYSRDSGPYSAGLAYAFDNNDKEDGVLLIGRTFSDTAAGIHFTPIARGGAAPNQWIDVVVNIGNPTNNVPPAITNFTVSNTNPSVGQTVNFAVSATDPNGDTLAYHWDMGDSNLQTNQFNNTNQTKSWTNTGYYVVRAEVSDMKGGKATTNALIKVGSPTDAGLIYGRVTQAGRPVEGALVRGGAVDAWTQSDGSYLLAGVPLGGVTVTAAKDGLTFTPRFSNPVQVTEFNTFSIDFTANESWTGGGGTVASVSPYQITLPLGFAAQFTAQAFDGSGNPVAFNPNWSVAGGGVIGTNGVFQAQSLGGPFVVTAQSGPVVATATVTVLAAPPGAAANGTWTNPAGGSWTTNANWAGSPTGVIASGPGNTADFSTLNISADTTVNLDAPRAIGNLVFGDTATNTTAGWIVANGTGGRLTLAGASPTITVNTLGPGKFANITAVLHGLNGFTKTGSGNLLLNNSSNPISGAIALSGGNLQLNNSALANATTVAINSGSLVVATAATNALGGTISFSGGTLQFNLSPTTDYSARFSTATNQPYRISVSSTNQATFNNSLISQGGSLTKLNSGRLTLAASNSYNGGTTLSGGTLNYSHASALGSGPVSFTANAVLQAGVASTLTNTIAISNGVTGTLDSSGTNTILAGIITGAGTLAKSGTGTLNISGGGSSNALSGPILVNVGTLANDSVTPSPGIQSLANMNGPISVAAGATLNFSQSFTTEPLDNAIDLSGSGTGGLGALNLWRNATASGPITLAADATISHNFNTATISGSITGIDRTLTLATTVNTQPGLVISGPIELGTGGITVNAAGGANTVTLSGTNSYSGETLVQTGTLRLTGAARMNDASTIRITSGAVLHLDFAGPDTVGALFLNGNLMPDGTYGSLTSAAANKSADFQGDGILQVGVANYASWAGLNGVTGGAGGDHDHDGVANLIEYALINGGERGVLNGTTITFTKRGAPYGNELTYIIEVSETLQPGSWTAAVTHNPAQLGTPISYNLAPGPGNLRKFARLKVVQTP